ncbi:hypothetical protein [Bradyrhizobium sp. Arg816]|uniref:hypothetical protein n=1 Tax=Bradyrhizobium sp. Arg816 TaxID=2998491 RepID=UPI00249E433B|nr:hypothetical protein [Bradyrhizobium sp. Arg816]MDI3563580.1 hypothetical protein [Bradyrhizobium sp. Arg816]
MTDSRQGASECMNDERTCTQSGAKLTHNVRGLFYELDCRSRRVKDATKRMAIELLMRHHKDGAPPANLARQTAIVDPPKPRYRVAANREVTL